MFGACIGRKVWLDQDVHQIFPLMSILLIGPSGIGKSTALRDMAMKNLVLTIPEENRPFVITGKSTKEAMHDDLMVNSHAIVLASELANLFSKEKYQEGLIPYVTDLLDLEPTSVRTKSGGLKTIQEPAVAFMGGSTKEWLQDQLPSTAVAGGFLPRFFIVKEDYKARRVPDQLRALSAQQNIDLMQKRIRTFDVFRGLVSFHRGPIEFADHNACDAYGLWYQSFTPDTGILSPFAARAGVHVLRLAILSALSCARIEIDAEDIRCGIALFEYSMSKLQEVIVPMSATGKLLNKVLETIGQEELSEIQVKRAMRNYCGSKEVQSMLQSLVESADIKKTDDGYRRTTGARIA